MKNSYTFEGMPRLKSIRGAGITFPSADKRGGDYRIEVGQRFHRAGFPNVIWTVQALYRDALGLEHATLSDDARRLDKKTLCASVLLDRSHYRLI